MLCDDAVLFCSRGNGCGRAGTGAKVCIEVVEGTNRFTEGGAGCQGCGILPLALLDEMAGEEDEVSKEASIRDC